MVSWASAQQQDTGRRFVINKDPRVDQLLELYKKEHSNKKFVDGYRIQIIASTDKKTMYTTRAKFRNQFPEIATFPTYEKPYFKLRVGVYEDKLKAQKDLDLIKNEFKGSFLVADEINVSELK